MRIGLLAPIALPVPPVGYGGTERVVSLLAEGLAARGHEVTLFASGDSTSQVPRRSLFPHALPQLDKPSYQQAEAEHVRWALAQGSDFDLIHDHTKTNGVLLASGCSVPVLTTVHNDFTPERRSVYLRFPQHPFVAISRAHAARLPELCFTGVIYNGIDLASLPDAIEKSHELLFLGRICAVKGAHTAIAVAKATGRPLILAGNVDKGDRSYFEEAIAPHLSDKLIRYVGEVSGERKWRLLSQAHCLLFPIQWPEPFGLVMIEAMACGTPVVALNRGAAPEVVGHGESGWLAEDFPELIEGVEKAKSFDPSTCRRWVEEHFSAHAMVSNYEKLYRRVAASVKARGP